MEDPRITSAVPTSAVPTRRRLRVTGVVQGVGFRPFVYTLARRLLLSGFVGNDSSGVFIEVEGARQAVDAFQAALVEQPPPLAYVESVQATDLALRGDGAFVIVHSAAQPAQRTLISPDICLCADCRRELLDPADRRYRYPFSNCTNCGPRFSIIGDIPYDRPLTSMAPFAMCAACQAEYDDPANRRFHAQPNACPDCGPQVWLEMAGWAAADGDHPAAHPRGQAALEETRALLTAGKILAVKGLGGFHLACDAARDGPPSELRRRKGRVDKPFAVMARDVATVRTIAHLDAAEEALLSGRERPILLLRRRDGGPLSPLVAPGNRYVGVMLPYTPLHELLLGAADPGALPLLVMTSANLSDEPIVSGNSEARQRLGKLADGVLFHDRAIVARCDDSVVRLFRGAELPLRRSRGYAPFPVTLPREVVPTLAVGGELKSTFCLAGGRHAFMSQHIGDMENLETLTAFGEAVAHFQRLYRLAPERFVCDLHPGYLSTRWAREAAGDRPVVAVQHHHAHIAAVMAENGLAGDRPVIGFSFDGTGYGTDGAIWGGEVLLADYRGFERPFHLAYVPLAGGDAAVQRPYRMALAHLRAAGVAWDPILPCVRAAPAAERRVLAQQLARNLNVVPTSSMGRLFDAIAALAGVRAVVSYEAQAAIELESLVDLGAEGAYAFALDETQGVFDAVPVVAAAARDVAAGVPAGVVGARFHRGVAQLMVDLARRLRAVHGLQVVALSGGVFQNVTLLGLAVTALQGAGFTVHTHRQVPPNDGGLALGQILIGQEQSGK